MPIREDLLEGQDKTVVTKRNGKVVRRRRPKRPYRKVAELKIQACIQHHTVKRLLLQKKTDVTAARLKSLDTKVGYHAAKLDKYQEELTFRAEDMLDQPANADATDGQTTSATASSEATA